MKNLPPQLQQLLQTKQGRIKLGAGAAVLFLLLLLALTPSSEPEVLAPTQVAEPEPKPVPPAPPNVSNSQIILELFNPSDATVAAQQNEAAYTQQIEQTMAVTFLLTKCIAISQDDYSNIFHALIVYAQRVGLAADAAAAEARVREIAQASSASYSLIYSRVTCEDPQLAPLARDVVLWANTMFSQQ